MFFQDFAPGHLHIHGTTQENQRILRKTSLASCPGQPCQADKPAQASWRRKQGDSGGII